MSSHNPFLLTAETIVSFSGGRTSGYMLYRILEAHRGSLPDHIKVIFSNTGKERTETLDFVQECDSRWGVPVQWLEFDRGEDHKVRLCNHNTASRNGEPFEAIIDSRGYLPNVVSRFCTTELKIRTMMRYARHHLGWEHWDNVVGLRADEPSRVAKLGNARERWETYAPLAEAGITKYDVADFWNNHEFDLELPNINGKTAHGNCDLCHLKSASTIAGLIREDPSAADWWIRQEDKKLGKKASAATFRNDRPSYREIRKAVLAQQDAFDDTGELNVCYCHD